MREEIRGSSLRSVVRVRVIGQTHRAAALLVIENADFSKAYFEGDNPGEAGEQAGANFEGEGAEEEAGVFFEDRLHDGIYDVPVDGVLEPVRTGAGVDVGVEHEVKLELLGRAALAFVADVAEVGVLNLEVVMFGGRGVHGIFKRKNAVLNSQKRANRQGKFEEKNTMRELDKSIFIE